MNAVTFSLSDEIQHKIEDMAAAKGVSVQALLGEMTTKMVEEFEAYKLFAEMAKQGKSEIEEALELLRR